jgi:hypothetical protein
VPDLAGVRVAKGRAEDANRVFAVALDLEMDGVVRFDGSIITPIRYKSRKIINKCMATNWGSKSPQSLEPHGKAASWPGEHAFLGLGFMALVLGSVTMVYMARARRTETGDRMPSS